jgi:hypothetical protein
LFLATYLGTTFCLEFSAMHDAVIAKAERAVLTGGLFALALPRGTGKTSLCEGAGLWAILYGYRAYVILIGATERKAEDMLKDLKTYLRHNELLAEDFPEIGAAASIPNLAYRSKNLTVIDPTDDQVKPAGFVWTSKQVVMPTVHGAPCGGAVIEVAGLTGDIRGRKHTRNDGSVIRPDLVIPDDPQTHESAGSETQCNDRERIIRKDVLGLAGPGRRIAGLMPCTIIQRGDLAHRMLDAQENPDWQGETWPMMTAMPEDMEAWQEYNDVRCEAIRDGKGQAPANEYYEAHRDALRAGATVTWDARVDEGDVDAVQTAMNLYFRVGKEAFQSEYQNDPIESQPALYEIRPEDVASRVNGRRAGVVADDAVYVTAFADITRVGFHWAICATRPDMTVDVVSYGKLPQRGELWAEGIEEENHAVYAAIMQWIPHLADEMIVMHKGERRRLDWCMVDCGNWTNTVIRALGNISTTTPVWPSRGMGSRAYKRPPDSRAIWIGDDCDIRQWTQGKVVAHNSDVYLKQVQTGFLLPLGAPGSISLNGDDPKRHQWLSEHVAAAKLVRFVPGGDRFDIYDWQTRGHNDLCDAIVGCIVGACRLGARLGGPAAGRGGKVGARKRRRAKVSYVKV